MDHMTAAQLKAVCKERGLKLSGKKDELKERIREHFMSGPSKSDQTASTKDEFDVIILSDLVNDLWDVQQVLGIVKSLSHNNTRIIFSFYSNL